MISYLDTCLFFCEPSDKLLIKAIVNIINSGSNYVYTEEDKKYPVNLLLIEAYARQITNKIFLKIELLRRLLIPLDVAKRYRKVCDKFSTNSGLVELSKNIVKRVMSTIEGDTGILKVGQEEDDLYKNFLTYASRKSLSDYRLHLEEKYEGKPDLVEDSPNFLHSSNSDSDESSSDEEELDTTRLWWNLSGEAYNKTLVDFRKRSKPKGRDNNRKDIKKREQNVSDRYYRIGKLVKRGNDLLSKNTSSEQVAKIVYTLELEILLGISQEKSASR
jgi:hypothetical protein